ncbi:MAG: alkaline phosphatase family protein [Planctomycetes bacterium]|nr:alkaline phosphatase family protein [Planctomycetota bacterium]
MKNPNHTNRDPNQPLEAPDGFGFTDPLAFPPFLSIQLRHRYAVAAWIVYVLCVALAIQSQQAISAGRPDEAYIGPGAGVALLGSCFAVFVAILTGLFYLVSFPVRMIWRLVRGRRALRKAKTRRVVVLGLDGLEPTLTEQFMAEGLLPNLARLRDQGCYKRLGTTWPPLSPVAWSSFSTGSNPGKHNIFDFIARTADYRPTISSVRIREARRTMKLFRFVVPLSKPEMTALRRSKPFWTVLGDAGVFSAILRVPITFPPDRFRGVQLSAMCVPDLRGTQGMFSHYVEQGQAGSTTDGDVGGDRILVERRGDAVVGYLRGPVNSLRADRAELRATFRVSRTGGGNSAVLHLGGETVPLKIGHHSPWVRVSFSAAPGIKVRGVCRFVLKRFEAPFEMYCTPIQIDPDKPVMPISHPLVYSSYLARRQGSFSTLGLAEDTWSLSEKVMSEDGFLEQAYDIHAEREKMFFDALEKVRRGLVVCVFDGPDRIQHMFWRFIDGQHPALTNEQRATHRHVIREMYQRMDNLVGRTIAKLGPDTTLFVMSDHGFKPFRRGVDLNAWLRDNGYLVLKDNKRVGSTPYLADIDWTRTRAYAVGLAGIFVNLKGREAAGIVEPARHAALVSEICRKLTGMKDGNGETAVHEAVAATRVYRGPYVENAPDIVVGYNAGYRVSWDAAIGKCGEAVICDNLKAWSGDHCVHPQLVPGVLFCSRRIPGEAASIIDLGPTVLDLFGISKPGYMDGQSLLGAA